MLRRCKKKDISVTKGWVGLGVKFLGGKALRNTNSNTCLEWPRCSAKIYPAAKNYPPPVTFTSVLSAVCIAQN